MKNEEEIRRQLEKVYEHRLGLRFERKMRPCCRNCKNGYCQEFDLGDFGTVSKWQCRDGKDFGEGCGFSCANTADEIEQEMISDISNPSVCGAKEPKIAMLLWVLHGSSKNPAICESVVTSSIQKNSKSESVRRGLFDSIRRFFCK